MLCGTQRVDQKHREGNVRRRIALDQAQRRRETARIIQGIEICHTMV